MTSNVPMSAVSAGDHSQLLALIWQRNLPTTRDRLERLEAAAREAEMGQLSASTRYEALSTAHKLAGCLGMFGFPNATETARQLELLLETDALQSMPQLRLLTERLRAQVPMQSPEADNVGTLRKTY